MGSLGTVFSDPQRKLWKRHVVAASLLSILLSLGVMPAQAQTTRVYSVDTVRRAFKASGFSIDASLTGTPNPGPALIAHTKTFSVTVFVERNSKVFQTRLWRRQRAAWSWEGKPQQELVNVYVVVQMNDLKPGEHHKVPPMPSAVRRAFSRLSNKARTA
jgi:hypothetical protein